MTLTINIWDVLQGLAIYVNTPKNNHITIDAGIGSNRDTAFYPLSYLNKSQGVKQIDYAILTHPHKDHIGEIKNVLALNPRVLCRPKHIIKSDLDWNSISDSDKELFETYFNLSDRYNQVSDYSTCPSNPSVNGGVEIKTFVPINCNKNNLNDHSVVTVISYAGSKELVPGDNEPPSWVELLNRVDFKKEINGTDIFIASHHGRKSGFHKSLFEYIRPKLIIVSDGPKTDTSAVSEYSRLASGWTVFSRSADKKEIEMF